MYKESTHLPQIDDSTVIWRYMDFVSLYSFLVNGTLFFKRLDKYTDELEGSLPPETIEEYRIYRKSIDVFSNQIEVDNWIENELSTIASFKPFILSNSWTISPGENYAMWKIYLRGYSEGVALQTTVGKLKKQLADNQDFTFYSGRVSYSPLPFSEINQFSVATNKRQAYLYENEYRALIIHQFDNQQHTDKTNVRIPRHNIGVEVKINVSDLVEQIYVSPFANEWFVSLLRKLIQDKLSGFDMKRIIYSRIKDH